ncbi:immunoglobulin superfamily member 8 [Rhinophrynus dorsalis]
MDRVDWRWNGLLLAAVLGLCSSREVKVPEGPLFRVEGTSISIPCNVSGYEGPSMQNFEWFMYRPEVPDTPISIASTKDEAFAYAVYASRVNSGDIYIHRVSGDRSELRIKRLRTEDTGVYECYTPTTDVKYLGSYSDKVLMKVLPDKLQVSAKSAPKGRLASSPLQLALAEGMELHLSCWALSELERHTHLSVSFGITVPDTPVGRQTLQEIISVHRDFSVEPAHTEMYTDRYLTGELRVDKLDSATYKLVIARVRPQDAGTYHCTAAQWIQDPDGSWQKITEKRSVLAQVAIQTIESQLKVSSRPQNLHVRSQDTVEMSCSLSLSSPLPPDVVFSVDWFMKSTQDSHERLVAALSTDGVVSLGEWYTGGEVGMRHISLEKLAPLPGTFRLRIHSAQPGDVGSYSCHVKVLVSYPGSRLEEVARKVSKEVVVSMMTQDIALNAVMLLDSPTLYSGDTAILLCNVTLDTNSARTAVSWWVDKAEKHPQETAGHMLAVVNREGVSEPGVRSSGEEMSTDKVGPQCYRLRMYNIQPEDEGKYYCTVTAWIQYPDNSWYNATSTKSNSITLYPYAQVKDLLVIPMVAGVASALFVGITILSTVTCCYMRHLRKRKR